MNKEIENVNIYRDEDSCSDLDCFDKKQEPDMIIPFYKKQYRDLFGMELEFPAFYVLGAKFFPPNSNFQLLIVKYQLPRKGF